MVFVISTDALAFYLLSLVKTAKFSKDYFMCRVYKIEKQHLFMSRKIHLTIFQNFHHYCNYCITLE